MSYSDEKIIEAFNSYKKEQHGDIYSGVFIKEELYQFERQELFEGKVSIMLPDNFVDMPPELARIKYPMEQRPQIIKMNEDGSINFTFSFLDIDVKNENLPEVIESLYMVIRNTQPANIFYEKKVEEINDTLSVGWFDYKSHGIDQKIYNLMYCIPMNGQLLHCVFNSPLQEVDTWKPIVLQVIHSIENAAEKE